MTFFYENIDKIINDECLKVMSKIPDQSVDLVLSDPPYQMETHGRGMCAKRGYFKEMGKYTNEFDDYFSDQYLNEYLRICKFPNVFLFCSKHDVIKILNFAKKNGFFYHILQICKKNPMPLVNNTWLTSEYAVHFTDRKIVKNTIYRLKLPYFLTGNEKETKHPNEKNIADVSKVIENLTSAGEIVFDGFSGSGTTAVACNKLNRHFLCVEKDPQYFEMSCQRLNDVQKQTTIFDFINK